jgi:hypothetical protein
MPAQRSDPAAIVFAIGALTLLAVVALFQVVLEPPASSRCSTSLAPGTFRSMLVPLHLGAAAILGGCLWELDANRRALAAVAAFALLSVVVPGVFGIFGWVVVLAAPSLGLLAVIALLIRTAIVVRSVREPAERRAALAGHARMALWLGLVVALPANLAFAWLSGVSVFCF